MNQAELTAAIDRDEHAGRETGVTQCYRWWLAELRGEAKRCAGCRKLYLLEDLGAGICAECSEDESLYQDVK